MPQQKLTIVPVSLHQVRYILASSAVANILTSVCLIKTANLEITFLGGVDEQVLQTDMGKGIDSLAETSKANGIDFYAYIQKLFLELPNLAIYQDETILEYCI